MSDIIYGRNAVTEALKSGRSFNKVVVALGNLGGDIKNITALAKEKGIPIERAEMKRMDKITQGERHQGVIAYVSPVEYKTLEDILEIAKEKNEQPFILLLDEITDPHNLGAIIRSAEAMGAHGILLPKRRSAKLNETVAKTSAGAVNYVAVAQIGNAAQTVENLKKEGFWTVGADMAGENIENADLTLPTLLVIGSEGKGIGRLLKEKLDILVKIPMTGKINSLNASVAAGILIYEVMKRRIKG
ncbi:MAG: 23S rRNA (guanosine(2251)-2'-O)-methyltransferase RlmB [Selenomonadaceae bacterium]|nr:23S rRNA (guanosine(2251)-2'-O)-methyltransferase RlmB [Selenomonadaceae bacterium]MBP3722978.1 23S rRNA (guanosine(2251)-2'-O)-methyltransferase RlmB [Selenomonadaceae bacterium]